jgi:hypothetical protein
LSKTEVVPTRGFIPNEVNNKDEKKSYPKIESEWTFHKVKEATEPDLETQILNSVTKATSTTTSTSSSTTTTTTTTSTPFITTSKPSPVQIFSDTINGGNAKTTNTGDVISSNDFSKVPSLLKDEEAFKAYSLLVNWISQYTSNVPQVLKNKENETEKEYQSFHKMFPKV